MKRIVLFSGGLASYFSAKRVIDEYGKEDVILFFTDTKIEDPDLYRFLDDAEKKLGIEITRWADGRDIWEVFKDRKFLGNSRVDPCSQELRRNQTKKFLKTFDSEETVVYIGYDYTELHRLERSIKYWSPFKIEAPLTEPPYLDKEDMKKLILEDGIEIPELYKLGLSHNNCSGGCVKAGIGHFAQLLTVSPERYAYWENKEIEIREYLNKDVSILKKRYGSSRKGTTVTEPLPLFKLREQINSLTESERCDIGGCGCFDEADI